MKHISFDLETFGTTPGSDIRSIGACIFDPTTGYVAGHDCPVGSRECPTFYIATDNPTMHEWVPVGPKYPLTRDTRTVQWWSEQSDEAQAAFADPVDLREALVRFGDWLASLRSTAHGEDRVYLIGSTSPPPDDIRIWSHGASFDPPILGAAYAAVGLPVPWHYRAPRDTRTLFDIAGIDDHSAWLNQHPGPLGISHHSLDDSICQARAVCAAWERVHQWAVDSDDLAGAR